MRIESVSFDGSARSLCILSRPSAEPRCVSPVPVTITCAGSLWSIGVRTRRSFNARARSTGFPTPRSAMSLRSGTPSAIAWRAKSSVVRAPLTSRLSPRAVTASARLLVFVDKLRQSHASAPSSAPELRRASISSKIRGSVKLLAANVAPASMSVRESSVVVMPTTARPAAAAARTPDRESSKAIEWARRCASPLKRRQIRQRVGLGARQLPTDHKDRQTLSDPKRRENLLSIGARRVRHHCALQSAPVGEIEQRKRAEDGLERRPNRRDRPLPWRQGLRPAQAATSAQGNDSRSSHWTRP